MAQQIKGLVANNTGRAPMPIKLTTKPPSGKAVYSVPRGR